MWPVLSTTHLQISYWLSHMRGLKEVSLPCNLNSIICVKSQSWGFTSHSTTRVVFGQLLSIVTFHSMGNAYYLCKYELSYCNVKPIQTPS